VIVAGPSVLDVFNTLLRHLRTSVDKESDVRRLSVVSQQYHIIEEQFQNAVVNAIGIISYSVLDKQLDASVCYCQLIDSLHIQPV